MNRRSFLATVSGLVAAPFGILAAQAKPKYKVLCDPELNQNESDRHSVRFETIHTGRGNCLFQEWTNDGRVTEHAEHPGDRPDSFVVAVDKYRHGIRLP